MKVAELHFRRTRKRTGEAAIDAIQSLLAAWRSNGQVLELAHPIARVADGYRVYVMIPERSALAARWRNEYVRDGIKSLERAGVAPPRIRVIGPEAAEGSEDRCEKRRTFILFTTFLAVHNPLRCGDCFRPVPLYRIPHTSGGDYHDIVSWNSCYQACDTLQMGCTGGERFGMKELSRHDSHLARSGRAICGRIEAATKVPIYYYLYRYGGRTLERERARPCPSCGGRWLLPEPWHRLFDFRCKPCRLISNIAWNVR
jgi:predicted  nucleic acid-binding Zn ribbon protein